MSEIDVQALAHELAPLIGAQLPKPLLDADEAAEMLNVPASWVLAEARHGRIPHHRLGKYVRFRRDEIADWLDRRVTANGRDR